MCKPFRKNRVIVQTVRCAGYQMGSEYDDLIRRLEKGRADAYRELFERFSERAYCLALNYVADKDVASDIVQEVFISVFDHSSALDGINNLKGYISMMVRNRCLNYLRDLDLEDRNMRLYYEDLLFSSLHEDLDERNGLIARLEGELPSLPESCRKICEMRFKRGMKVREIAEELDIAVSTVKVLLHRAVAKIKGNLGVS